MTKAAKYSEVERLRDGREIEIRALRPADEAEMLAAVDRTSAQSLYRRLFGPKRHFSAGKVKLLVIVRAEKWVNGLVLPAVSRGTFGRALSWRWCPLQKGVFS